MHEGQGHGCDFLAIDDRGGWRVRIDAGTTLLRILRGADIEVGAVCDGNMNCGTCHVFIEPAGYDSVHPPTADEIEMVKNSRQYRPDLSRLACQVQVSDALSAYRVTVAPDE